MQPTYGLLIVNLGTPAEPSPKAVRRYLNQFLSDKRVVDLPAWLWQPLLKGVITPLRSRRSAKNYQKIWTPEGSPLRIYTETIVQELCTALGSDYSVELAMCYGQPSIKASIHKLLATQIDHLIVLPLYPQYSTTTTAAVFDQIAHALQGIDTRLAPALHLIHDYHQHPAYIAALAASVRAHINVHGKPQKLLFSFHGIPVRTVEKGDPYPTQCEATAAALASSLGLSLDQWQLSYQSRFGKAAWILPETLSTLANMPAQGITDVAVLCPGFAVDCLETLEEIAILNREVFLAAGGKQFHYIPALNASQEHIDALQQIISEHCEHSPPTPHTENS